MPKVNLDALIRREDFDVVTSGEQMPKKQALQISDGQLPDSPCDDGASHPTS